MAAKGKSSIFATLIVYMIYTGDYTGSTIPKSNWINSMESESVKYGQKVSIQKKFLGLTLSVLYIKGHFI